MVHDAEVVGKRLLKIHEAQGGGAAFAVFQIWHGKSILKHFGEASVVLNEGAFVEVGHHFQPLG